MANENRSCIGCRWLYSQDTGWSDWTVESTSIICALNRNTKLPADEPFDWNKDQASDNWPATQAGRCSVYAEGIHIHLSVEGEPL